MTCLRVLDFSCDELGTASDDARVLQILQQNKRLEILKLFRISANLAQPLAAWLERDAPACLQEITLALEMVSEAEFARVMSALSHHECTNLYIEDSAWGDPEDARHACYATAALGLISSVSSLRSLEVNAYCFRHFYTLTDAPALPDGLAKIQRDEGLTQAVLAHPSLEWTNLVYRTDANRDALHARALRRHRLAGHWMQVALLIAFMRVTAQSMHGSILPLLPTCAALAGCVLPKSGWLEGLARTAYFANALVPIAQPVSSRTRLRRKRPRD